MIRNRDDVRPYVTKDGSTVWELYHPGSSPVDGVSVAEAYVEKGTEAGLHVHRASQEIYYVLGGAGTMWLGDRRFEVRQGDAVLIRPGTSHRISGGAGGVRILCICAPPYSHEDTDLVSSKDTEMLR